MPYNESKVKAKIREIRNCAEPVVDGFTGKIYQYEVKKEHFQWLLEQSEKIEKYEKALKEIERWDTMLYSQRELGNFAKKALGLPITPLKD